MFVTMILLGILGLIATDLYVPSLPAIGQVFNQPLNHTQLTLSLFLVGFAFSQLIYGPISDRVGRKPPLFVGVVLFIIGSLICVFASTFEMFCVGRIIEGIAVGSGLSLVRVILRDRYEGSDLAVKSSQMGVFVAATPAVAPYVGGILQEFGGYKVVFWFLCAYGFLLLFLLTFCFKETIKYKHKTLGAKHVLVHYGELLRNFQFMRYVVIAGFAFGSVILYVNILPFVIQEQLHLSAQRNGEILLFAAFGLCLAAFVSSRIVKRYTSEKLVALGLGILTFSGVGLVVSGYCLGPNLIATMPLIFLVTFACGFIFPNALALAFAQINLKIGIAGAVYGCVQISISMLLNFLLNGIPHQGLILLGGFYGVLGILGLTLTLFKTQIKSPHHS